MKLQEFLNNKKISQRKFARMAGTSQALISYYIKGLRTPSLKTMERIYLITDGSVTPRDFAIYLPSYDNNQFSEKQPKP